MNPTTSRPQESTDRVLAVSTRRAASDAAHRPEPLKGALAGFIGGIAGTLAMDSTLLAWTLLDLDHVGLRGSIERIMRLHHTGFWGQSEPRTHHFAEDTPSENIAALFLQNLGVSRHLIRVLRRPGGTFLHYGFGATVGAIYGVIAEFAPSVTQGGGLPFGAAVLIAADEVALPAAGLARGPLETRPSAHAYAAAGHFAYGFVTEFVRSAIRGRSRRTRAN